MRAPLCDCDDCVAWESRSSERAAMEAELTKLRAENAQLRADRTRLLTELVDKRTAISPIAGDGSEKVAGGAS